MIYVTLIGWTDQGIRNVSATINRYETDKQGIEKAGGKVLDIYWTLGAYDAILITEWPDDETATAFLLSWAAHGSIRSETLRAFDESMMKRIVAKLSSAGA